MTLGQLLRQARKERGLTAKDVIKHTGLKASPSLYSQWENDIKVPMPLDLRVLCLFCGINLSYALNLWAAAHMPTAALKQTFLSQLPSSDKDPKGRDIGPIAYPAAFTIMIREQDAEWFTKHHQAGSLLKRCLMFSNQSERSATPEKLAKGSDISAATAETLCAELLKRKYIHKHGKGYRTAPDIKYLYLPPTEPFEPMRRGRILVNMESTLENISPKMIYERRAARETVFSRIPADKVSYFVDSIEALANEMITLPDNSAGAYHQFVCVFGPEDSYG